MSKHLEHSDSDVSLASTVHMCDLSPRQNTPITITKPKSVLLQPKRQPIYLDFDIYDDATAPGKLSDKNHCSISYSKHTQQVAIHDHVVSSFNSYTKHKLSSHPHTNHTSYQFSNPNNITCQSTGMDTHHNHTNNYDTHSEDHPHFFNEPSDYNHDTTLEYDTEVTDGSLTYSNYF